MGAPRVHAKMANKWNAMMNVPCTSHSPDDSTQLMLELSSCSQNQAPHFSLIKICRQQRSRESAETTSTMYRHTLLAAARASLRQGLGPPSQSDCTGDSDRE